MSNLKQKIIDMPLKTEVPYSPRVRRQFADLFIGAEIQKVFNFYIASTLTANQASDAAMKLQALGENPELANVAQLLDVSFLKAFIPIRVRLSHVRMRKLIQFATQTSIKYKMIVQAHFNRDFL